LVTNVEVILVKFVLHIPAEGAKLPPAIKHTVQVTQTQEYVLVYCANFAVSPEQTLFDILQMTLDLHLDIDWLLKSYLNAWFEKEIIAVILLRNCEPQAETWVRFWVQLLDKLFHHVNPSRLHVQVLH